MGNGQAFSLLLLFIGLKMASGFHINNLVIGFDSEV